jgi:hypothetical protein
MGESPLHHAINSNTTTSTGIGSGSGSVGGGMIGSSGFASGVPRSKPLIMPNIAPPVLRAGNPGTGSNSSGNIGVANVTGSPQQQPISGGPRVGSYTPPKDSQPLSGSLGRDSNLSAPVTAAGGINANGTRAARSQSDSEPYNPYHHHGIGGGHAAGYARHLAINPMVSPSSSATSGAIVPPNNLFDSPQGDQHRTIRTGSGGVGSLTGSGSGTGLHGSGSLHTVFANSRKSIPTVSGGPSVAVATHSRQSTPSSMSHSHSQPISRPTGGMGMGMGTGASSSGGVGTPPNSSQQSSSPVHYTTGVGGGANGIAMRPPLNHTQSMPIRVAAHHHHRLSGSGAGMFHGSVGVGSPSSGGGGGAYSSTATPPFSSQGNGVSPLLIGQSPLSTSIYVPNVSLLLLP